MLIEIGIVVIGTLITSVIIIFLKSLRKLYWKYKGWCIGCGSKGGYNAYGYCPTGYRRCDYCKKLQKRPKSH